MPRVAKRSPTAVRGLVILLALGASACPQQLIPPPPPLVKSTGENEYQVAGTTPPSSLGGPRDTSAGITFVARKTPKLTSYIESLDEGQLLTYLNSLKYDRDPLNTETETVTCIHMPSGTPCAPGDGAEVSVEPEIGAHMWKHADVPQYGFIVARLINYDPTDRMEATFKIPASTQAWWVVDQDPVSHQPRSRFFRRSYSSSPPYVVQLGTTHDFLECGHAHKTGHLQAITKFVNCSQSLTMAAPHASGIEAALRGEMPASERIYRLASFGTSIPLPAHPEIMQLRATWVTCEMGCCSTSM
jgi:hypothetical protein